MARISPSGCATLAPRAATGRAARGAKTAEPFTPRRAFRSTPTAGRPSRALIAGTWKLIEAPAPELYDVVADAAEGRDLYRVERTRASTLEQTLATRFGRAEQPPRESRAAPDPASDAALRSLGYVAGRGVARRTGAPPDPKTMMDVHRGVERGEGLLHARDFAGAQRELRAVLDRDPENLAALEGTATALAELGRFDSAEGALKRALAIAPDRASLHLAMAQIDGARGDWNAALTRADAAAALAPEEPAVLAVRAQALDRLGRAEDARLAIDRALAIAPADPLLAVRYVEIVELPGRRYEERTNGCVVPSPSSRTWRLPGGRSDGCARRPGARPTPVPRISTAFATSRATARCTPRSGCCWWSPIPARALASGTGRRALADAAARGPQRAGGPAGVERRDRGRRRQWTRVVRATESATAPEDRHQRAIALRSLGRRDEAESVWRELTRCPDRSRCGVARAGGGGARPQGVERRGGGGATGDRDRPRSRDRLEHPGDRDRGDRGQGGVGAALSTRGRRPADLLAGEPQSRPGAARSGPLRRGGQAFEAVLAIAPEHAKSQYELGLLYAGPLGDAARARDHLERGLRLDPASPRAADARAALAQLPPQNRKPTEN